MIVERTEGVNGIIFGVDRQFIQWMDKETILTIG